MAASPAAAPPPPQASITCPVCALASHNPLDVKFEYCGNCEAYHADLTRGEAVLPRFSVPARILRAEADLRIASNECKLLAGVAADAAVQLGQVPPSMALVARGAAADIGRRVTVALMPLTPDVPIEVVKAMSDIYADWVRGEGLR